MNDEPPKELWRKEFGEKWSQRNPQSPTDVDENYRRKFGVTRTDLNERFLSSIPRDAHILEVGCNIGSQLLLLREIGYSKLYGVDVQPYAIQKAHSLHPQIGFFIGEASNLPFETGFFDLVFTSGLLIHIPPDEITDVLSEIVRCSRKWIGGYEYYSDEYEGVQYRGYEDLLWKTDFAQLYLDNTDTELIEHALLEYEQKGLCDQMFLLQVSLNT